MEQQKAIEYFSKLLNKLVFFDTKITLTSAQKARVHGWLVQNKIPFNEMLLSKKFSLIELIGSTDHSTNNELSLKNEPDAIDIPSNDSLVGVDIQHVSELFPLGLPLDPKGDGLLMAIFTSRELSYAQTKEAPEMTLTGIFCAKEAIQKASNTKLALNEIEVLPNELGRPICEGFAISISHSINYAVAIALRESCINRPNEISNSIGGLLNIEPSDINAKKPNVELTRYRKLDLLFLLMLFILSFLLLNQILKY